MGDIKQIPFDERQNNNLRLLLIFFGVIWLFNAAFQASGWIVAHDGGASFIHLLEKTRLECRVKSRLYGWRLRMLLRLFTPWPWCWSW